MNKKVSIAILALLSYISPISYGITIDNNAELDQAQRYFNSKD